MAMIKQDFIPAPILLIVGLLFVLGCASRSYPAAGSNPPKAPVSHPVYPLGTINAEELRKGLGDLLTMEDSKLLALVPPQPGFYFGGCPNCTAGSQEHQITWSPALGNQVQCLYCKHLFPDSTYPENETIQAKTPDGHLQEFHVYTDKQGKRYWFEARRWYMQRELMESSAYSLAKLYAATGDRDAGRRAALILKRFADLFPGYIPRYDFPFRPKRLYSAGFPDATELADIYDPHRAAKWDWWGYMDVSATLLKAYDLLLAGDILSEADRAHIEYDLFRGMLAHVAKMKGFQLTNMDPILWMRLMNASRVLDDPSIAESVFNQMHQMLATQFRYDGFWREPTPSYHLQTAGTMYKVLKEYQPDLGDEALQRWASAKQPELAGANLVAEALRLPDNRYAPMSDTWWFTKSDSKPITASVPVLMPALGYAILGMGAGSDQFQAHLNFTDKRGHEHYDALSILLFANGRELLSDIGYTHTRCRPWATNTASHNTVVIDQKCQAFPSPDGGDERLLLFNASDPMLQVVEADAPNAYRGVATAYRRFLAAVQSPGGRYVVDVFDVAGGNHYDWILHGSADEPQTLDVTAATGAISPFAPVSSLLPKDYRFEEPDREEIGSVAFEGPWAYGMFRDISSASSDADLQATFRCSGEPESGLRSWILGSPGTKVLRAVSPAVRGAREDDSKLNIFRRQSLIISRTGGGPQRFVALHCPFKGDSGVKGVTRLPSDPETLALRIDRVGGVDYFLLNSDGRMHTARDGSTKLILTGKVGFASCNGPTCTLKMINGSRLSVGARSITGRPAPHGKLLSVKGNRLLVQGAFDAAPGSVIIIKHGNGMTSGFHVAKVQKLRNAAQITTRELPAFSLSGDGKLIQTCYPLTSYPGPSEVFGTSLYSRSFRDKGAALRPASH